jgi:anti-sigma B factor antagonist
MADADAFSIVTEDVGDDVRIVALHGEADRFRTDDVNAAIERTRDDARKVIVDMSAASYVDSSMLATLVAASEYGSRRSGGLVVLCETPRLRRSLQLKGLESIFHLAETREQALELAAARPVG